MSIDDSQLMVIYGDKKIFDAYIESRLQSSQTLTSPSTQKKHETILTMEQLQAKISLRLCQLFAKTAKMQENSIEPTIPFWEYGIDSILIVTLNKELECIFGEISKTLFFEYKTIQDLSAHLITIYREECLTWINEDSKIVNSDMPHDPIHILFQFHWITCLD
jgi:acyl carrier protein